MDIRVLLQANCEKLLEQYNANLEALIALQTTLIEDILPSVIDELQLDAEALEWAKEWLKDTPSLFQISRRNNFTRSFAMESIRKTLVWRFKNMWPLAQPPPISVVHCFPDSVRDPLGRPILLIKVTALDESAEHSKPLIIQGIDRLRHHLTKLNDGPNSNINQPILQYIVLLDLTGLSMQSISIDLITWALREVIPRFPGMLAAVFMINYSWAHSGIWSVVKRILPAPALSRVFFPTHQELIQYFTTSSLPKEYGGTLPSLTHLDDPLRTNQAVPSRRSPSLPSASIQSANIATTPAPRPFPVSLISPTSLLNPFFGYPVSSTRGSPTLHHGRRRKRDLVRTLALLLWMRWRRHITVFLWLVAFTFAIRLWTRKWLLRTPSGLAAWKAFSSGFRW